MSKDFTLLPLRQQNWQTGKIRWRVRWTSKRFQRRWSSKTSTKTKTSRRWKSKAGSSWRSWTNQRLLQRDRPRRWMRKSSWRGRRGRRSPEFLRVVQTRSWGMRSNWRSTQRCSCFTGITHLRLFFKSLIDITSTNHFLLIIKSLTFNFSIC